MEETEAVLADSLMQTPTKPSIETVNVTPAVMTPNTRQRKSRLSQKHTQFIEDLSLADDSDVVNVVILSLKNLGLYDKLQEVMGIEYSSNENRGRKMTAFATRKLV